MKKKWTTILALVLIAAGVFALVQGGFTYTKEKHSLDLGPVELNAKNRERVEIPQWAGIGAIAVGVVLLVVGRR